MTPKMDRVRDRGNGSASHPVWGVRANLIASYVGKTWFVIIAIACTPYYVRQLGPEGYGLVGFFLTLQRLSVLLDAGFSTTINREIAQQNAKETNNRRIPDMLRTLEITYWAIASALFVSIASASDWISSEWLGDKSFSQVELKSIVILMGLAIAIQLPQGFYSAALMGQERHVLLSIIRMSWHSIRFIGAAIALMVIAPTPFVFFGWQVMSGVIVTFATAVAIWSSLHQRIGSARFRLKLLREVFVFTAGAGIFTVTAALITQLDKVILSKQLSAEQFGYYMLAYSIPGVLFVICSPIYSVIFPKLSKHLALRDTVGLKRSYHLGSQLTTFTILPLAVVGVFFSWEILEAWLGNPKIADECYLLARFLFCGIGINCLSSMPHALQMAHGWTRLANVLNLMALSLLLPALVWACSYYGAVGASLTWIGYSTIYLVLQVHFMHQKLLPDEKRRWTLEILWPLLLTLILAGIARLLLHPTSRLETLASLVLVWGMCCLVVAATCPLLRRAILAFLYEKRTSSAKHST